MEKIRTLAMVMLIVTNSLVLLGQVWPEAAPPFARTVNVVFLVASLAFLISQWRRRD